MPPAVEVACGVTPRRWCEKTICRRIMIARSGASAICRRKPTYPAIKRSSTQRLPPRPTWAVACSRNDICFLRGTLRGEHRVGSLPIGSSMEGTERNATAHSNRRHPAKAALQVTSGAMELQCCTNAPATVSKLRKSMAVVLLAL